MIVDPGIRDKKADKAPLRKRRVSSFFPSSEFVLKNGPQICNNKIHASLQVLWSTASHNISIGNYNHNNTVQIN